jgi:hypothetical protein
VSKARFMGVALFSVGLTGCGYLFPSFEGALGIHSYIHDIPVGRVTTELQCELGAFLHEEQNHHILDRAKPATVTIKFQTDQSGTFQYVGIDLSKIGLPGLANLIAPSNKVPSLQAKGQVKTTAFSQLDLAIAQTYKNYPIPKLKSSDPQRTISGLIHTNCDPSRKLLASLSLQGWLDRFFDHIGRNPANWDAGRDPQAWKSVCLSRITLSTQIVLVLDVSAGVNPLVATTFVVPVSGETFDYNPSATQSLTIVLSLLTDPNNPTCKQAPQPNLTPS